MIPLEVGASQPAGQPTCRTHHDRLAAPRVTSAEAWSAGAVPARTRARVGGPAADAGEDAAHIGRLRRNQASGLHGVEGQGCLPAIATLSASVISATGPLNTIAVGIRSSHRVPFG